MKGFLIAIVLILLLATLAAPFVLKGPDGKPLLTPADLSDPAGAINKLTDRAPQATNPLTGEAITPPKRQTVYKWKDEAGQIHYTTEPPPAGIQAETQRVNPNENVITLEKPQAEE